jgi:hypothetical protein
MKTFYECKSLKTIVIPDTVGKISEEAFFGCENIENVIFPSSITDIWNGAFKNCLKLKSITFPLYVKNINQESFMNCTSLTSVCFINPNTKIVEEEIWEIPITGPHSAPKPGYTVYPSFEGCVNLTTVYGHKNSTAETFAKNRGIQFVLLDSNKTETVRVFVNDKELKFDVNPIVENSRTLVPFRAIFESLGAKVSWNEAEQKVFGQMGDISIELAIGNTNAYVNKKKITLDVPPKIINGRTLVPLRFVAENFGYNVKWVDDERCVYITGG